MRIYRDLELVEQLGSGIPRVLQTYGRECFKFSDNYVRMSFPIEVPGENEEKVTEKVTETQHLILENVKKKPYMTSEELSKIIGISAVKIRVNITKLKEKGLIERIGAAKGGYWKVIDNEKS